MSDGYHSYPSHPRPDDAYSRDLSANFENLSVYPPAAPHRNPSPHTYPQQAPPNRYPNPTIRQGIPSQQQGLPPRNYGDAPRRPLQGSGASGWAGRPPPQNVQQRRPGPPLQAPPNGYGQGPVRQLPGGRQQLPPPSHNHHHNHNNHNHSQVTGLAQFHRPRPPPPQGADSYGNPRSNVWSEQQNVHPSAPRYDRIPNPPSDLGRSQTMPLYSNQQSSGFSQDHGGSQYYGRNNYQPSYDGGPNQAHGGYRGSPTVEDPRAREFDPMRGSVGDVLDLYSYDDAYGAKQQYHDARSNSLHNAYYSENTQPQNPNHHSLFDSHGHQSAIQNPQAHRSKSQPNLRRDGPPNQAYADPLPPPPLPQQQYQWNDQPNGGYGGYGGSSTPQPIHRYGNNSNQSAPGSESQARNNSLLTSRPPPQRVYPNSGTSDPSNPNSNPSRNPPGPSFVNPTASDDPDALPEHPAPIRPGLSNEGASINPNLSQNTSTLPQTDSSVGHGSSLSSHDTGPVTFDMLNLLRNEIASKPANQPATPNLQFRFARRLVEASFILAKDADPKAARRSRENFTLEAHKIIKRLASGTHPYPEAMFYLANCYGDGTLGLEVDHDKAFSLYQSAAKLNHSPSAYRTAVCCEIGAGTKKEPQKAFQWYRKAATLGDTAAMYKVGMILHKGLLGQPRNDREAIIWLKRAAEQADQENPHALHQLGILYESADGNGSIVRDMAYAKELFSKAAELGYPPSQHRLGTAYAYGLIGCPIDAKLSITWYSRAAASGDAESELALAGWYLTGAEGVLEQNDTEAYLWSRKAAEQGLAKAEFAVGHLTELGIGLDGKGSDEEARNWYFRAAGQGHLKAKERLEEMRRGAPRKTRERLSRHNKAKDDADCSVM